MMPGVRTASMEPRFNQVHEVVTWGNVGRNHER
jgi:hypothetical protein